VMVGSLYLGRLLTGYNVNMKVFTLL